MGSSSSPSSLTLSIDILASSPPNLFFGRSTTPLYRNEIIPTVINVLAFIARELAADSRMCRLMTDKVCTVDKKFDVFNELFTLSPTLPASKEKKRASWMSTNEDVVHCVALKKRARMLQLTQQDASDSMKPAVEEVIV